MLIRYLDLQVIAVRFKHLALLVRRAHGAMLCAGALSISSWAAPAPSYSAGLLFLKEAPIRFFSEEDQRLFKQAVLRTLEKVPDGKTSSWKNPATESAGAMKPIRTYQDNGRTCRTLRILNRAGGRTGQENAFDFCRRGEGNWKAAP
jgi:surface antigen